MDKKLTDLKDRLRNGEKLLAALPSSDPKSKSVKAKVDKLRKEIAELERGNVVPEGAAQPSNQTYDRVSVQGCSANESPHITDPRPDFTEDTAIWAALLNLCNEYDEELTGILHGFRCGGTRLKVGRQAGRELWILRPDIDPTGNVAWSSQAEYEEAKELYLKEWAGVLKAMLDELTRRMPMKGDSQSI